MVCKNCVEELGKSGKYLPLIIKSWEPPEGLESVKEKILIWANEYTDKKDREFFILNVIPNTTFDSLKRIMEIIQEGGYTIESVNSMENGLATFKIVRMG